MRRGPTLYVFLVAQALYLATASGWPWRSPDEFEVYFQAESLVERGSLAIPQVDRPDWRGGFFGRRDAEKRPYAPYGPLVAFAVAPFRLVAGAVTADFFARGGLACLASATAGALAVAGFFRAARARAGPRDALLLSLALATTVLWPYSKTLFSESFSAAAFTWAWVFIEEKRLAPATVLLAAACLIKATNAVFALPLALACEARATGGSTAVRRSFLVLGPVAAGLVHMEWNSARFGDPFQLGYDWHETIPKDQVARPFGSSLLRGLAVLVLSPGKSIFVWAPCLLLAVKHLREDRAIALAGGVGLLVFAKYMFPEGGYCHGPRHLVPLLPLLLLPATRGFSRPLLIACVILGASMNLIASSVSYLEDQAMGDGMTRFEYYEWRADAAEGLPRNVYRLGYLPQLSLVRTLLASEGRGPGTGLDFFFRHVPRPIGLAPLALAAISGALGLLGLRKSLLSSGNTAILQTRSP